MVNKIISLLLCLTLLFGLTACGAQTIDQAGGQPVSQPEQSAGSAPAAESDAPASADPVPVNENDEFTLEDAPEETQDFSKYQEVVEYKYNTDPVPDGKQAPVEPGDVPIDKGNQKTCFLSISCETILNNMGDLADGKEVLVPSDGIILPRTEVVFYDGESVFDVLQRETKNRMIHMESTFTPMYNSAYIKGIGNLYEFDCGSESGWQYSVNGWYPNYGVSRYVLQAGDDVAFRYTCDLGRDLGADWMG